MSALLTAKKDLKRQRILDAAKRRFGRFGIRATTMQEIARDADIAVGTIYQFFPDKDALILAWLDEQQQLVVLQLQEVLARSLPADEKLREFLRLRFHTVRAIREEPAIAEITRAVMRLAPGHIQEALEAIPGHLQRILDEGVETGVLPSAEPARDAEILLHALAGFFPSANDPIMGPPEEKTLLRVVDWFIEKWKLPRPKSRH
jgi:AcrR family transcriptional regulator